jgi:hypothetical protein
MNCTNTINIEIYVLFTVELTTMTEHTYLKSIYNQLCNHSTGSEFMKKFMTKIIEPTQDYLFDSDTSTVCVCLKLRYDPEDARDFHYEIVFSPPVYSYVCGSIQISVIKNSLNDRHILHKLHRQSCICVAGNVFFGVNCLVEYMKLVDTYSMGATCYEYSQLY